MTALVLPRVRVDATALGLALLTTILLGVGALGLVYRAQVPSDGTAFGNLLLAGESDGALVEPLAAGRSAFLPGDRVLAVEGRSIADLFDGLLRPGVAGVAVREGQAVSYQVARDGATVEVTVSPTAYPIGELLLASWALLLLNTTIVGTALYLVLRRPHEPAAQALLVLGLGMFVSTVGWVLGLQIADLVTGWGFWIYLASSAVPYTIFFGGVLHFVLVFPRQLPLLERHRWPLLVAYGLPLAFQLLPVVVVAVGGAPAVSWLTAWARGIALMQPVVLVAAVGLLIVGYRSLEHAQARRQVRSVAVAIGVAATAGILFWFGPEAVIGRPLLPWNLAAVTGLPVPIALGLAISRHRLFGLETLLRRSLVYGGLTAGVVLVYATTVMVLAVVLPGDGPYAVTLLATGAAALVALPLRDRLQRAVGHLLYGDRDQPYRAIARLAERLEASLEPDTVLPMVAETVADALRLPYAAIELRRNGAAVVAAAHGAPRGELERLPLVHHGQEVGWLALAQRAPNEPFSAADRALLADLARQAGAAAYAVRLTGDLQRSRQQLVSTREEERRRLRRDLHDGVGPSLAGSLMKLEAARTLAGSRPEDVERLLDELATETRRTIEDVRRLAYDLRPPALDQLGLVEALAQEAQRLAANGSVYTVGAAGSLAALPAAVEVAAYRIGLEALTNVAHHAQATRAWVDLRPAPNGVAIEVRDNGRGLPGRATGGVGLTSMRERAEELGGTLEIGTSVEGGLRVSAWLPLPESSGRA